MEKRDRYHLRVHARIDSISTNDGSLKGNVIEILGKGFGIDKNNVQVEIGSLPIEILELSNERILAKVLEDSGRTNFGV